MTGKKELTFSPSVINMSKFHGAVSKDGLRDERLVEPSSRAAIKCSSATNLSKPCQRITQTAEGLSSCAPPQLCDGIQCMIRISFSFCIFCKSSGYGEDMCGYEINGRFHLITTTNWNFRFFIFEGVFFFLVLCSA